MLTSSGLTTKFAETSCVGRVRMRSLPILYVDAPFSSFFLLLSTWVETTRT